MCGRYNLGETVVKDLEDILADAMRNMDEESKERLKSRGEIFPTNIVPVLSRDGAQAMHWGMPLYDGKYPNVFNSRDDKLSTNGEYIHMLNAGLRCLVPIIYYYEWKKIAEKEKVRYAFRLQNKPLMYVAGIYKTEGVKIPSFSIITTTPSDEVAKIHNRMPLILAEDAQKEWLSQSGHVQNVLSEGIRNVAYQEDDDTPRQMSML